ncbi:MAG: ABC transporter substrate-binding protein, partial [Deinococcus sp.]|nr:ABC transporter substrate-binding protein [Deinococcus sp.]
MRKLLITLGTAIALLVLGSGPSFTQGGNTLTVAIQGDLGDLDPHVNQLILFKWIRLNVYNALTRYDENLQIVPDLAESWETSDTQHWTFTLRSGVLFHNGRTLTADDVQSSLQRAAASTSSLAARVQNIESIEVLSPTQVQVNLKTPSAAFLDDIVPITIVPQEAADTLSTNPVGTGPFRFVEAIPNDRIVLERYSDYFEPGVPQIDRLVLRVIV